MRRSVSGRRCAITLVVGDYLHLAVLKHSNTGVSGAQVDANSRSFTHDYASTRGQKDSRRGMGRVGPDFIV
ncbi:unnamed protein product [Schistocephalus solidus]|uniref:Transposase n=1 Tax=Schistocephalus solidus TaxID=70667 RepID=A0A183TTY0_SCHSO|nr:unnamed protein product [Schistocephalus solidus]